MPMQRRLALISPAVLLAISLGTQAQVKVTIELVARSGRRASGPDVVRLKKGDLIMLTVTSDVADELHLHGYDLHLRLLPDHPATLSFTAARTGRFSAELHKAGAKLTTLEIYPL